LTASFAFLAGCTAWMFNNIATNQAGLLYFDAVTILALAGIILVLFFEIINNINKLEV
jgi:hypothetical protein